MNPRHKPTETGLIRIAARIVVMYIRGDRDGAIRKLCSFPPAISAYLVLAVVELAGDKGEEMRRALSRALAHRFAS
jgi:hypothetical protein